MAASDLMTPSTIALLLWLVLPIVLLILWLRARKMAKTFKEKYLPIMSIEAELDRLQSSAEQIQKETDEVRAKYAEKRSTLRKLEQQVAIYDERLSFAELGIYEPHFDFGDSETDKRRWSYQKRPLYAPPTGR